MSVRRDPRSPFYTYNFQIHGRRFFGPTKKTTRREAEVVERQERERAKALIVQVEQARTSLRLDDIAGRYWTEHAQHLTGALNVWTLLGILIEYFGKDKLLTEMTDDDVAKLVAWRRGHRAKFSTRILLSPHTVNHTTTTLRKLFTRAKLWGVRFAHEPKWTRHLLKVPVERVRELSDDEADKLAAAMRADYVPFFAFMRVNGTRSKASRLSSSVRAASALPFPLHLRSPTSCGPCAGTIPNMSSPTSANVASMTGW